MDLIPDEELKPKGFMNLTPMVDFLFLVIAVFATLAVTRTALFDSEVRLAKIKEPSNTSLQQATIHVVNLSITKEGKYKWVTEFNEYAMEGVEAILLELDKQQSLGLLPQDKSKTKILLHVDKKAEWDPVIKLIYSVRKVGYSIHPVYELGSV